MPVETVMHQEVCRGIVNHEETVFVDGIVSEIYIFGLTAAQNGDAITSEPQDTREPIQKSANLFVFFPFELLMPGRTFLSITAIRRVVAAGGDGARGGHGESSPH